MVNESFELLTYFVAVASIGILGIALTRLHFSLYRRLTDPLNKIPGPLAARFTNLQLKRAVITGRRVHYVHSLHQIYGPVVRISPNEIAVADPAAHKQIHGVASGFQKTQWYFKFSITEHKGIFQMTDPIDHAARRRLLARAFSKTHLRSHWESVVQQKVQLAMSRICEEANFGPVDVLKWFTFLASDVSTKIMFGQDFQTLEHGEVSPYIRALQLTTKGGGIGAELTVVRWIGKRLPLRMCQELFNGNETLTEYGRQAVAGMKKDPNKANIFANMMAMAEKGECLNDGDVRDEGQGLIIAGTDTSSITLTYLVWATLSRPDLQKRLEAEVGSLSTSYSDADLEGLELLNAVIQETLRLYGAAPGGLPRIVPAGGAVIGGYSMPAGTTVTTQAYTLHRDKSLFPDPLSFIPERWMSSAQSSTHSVSDAAKAVFSPLGTGSRSCLGVHLALMQLRLAAAEFFRKCPGARLAPTTTPKTMKMENYFLISPVAHRCDIIIKGPCSASVW